MGTRKRNEKGQNIPCYTDSASPLRRKKEEKTKKKRRLLLRYLFCLEWGGIRDTMSLKTALSTGFEVKLQQISLGLISDMWMSCVTDVVY